MKVLHLPYTYFPEPSGGTEVYVADLVRELRALDVSGAIAYASPESARRYEWDHVPVHRVQLKRPRSLDAFYGAADRAIVAEYLRVATEERPDVIHLHAYTPTLNGAVARALRTAGFRVVATYHTPTVTCQRGTLLRFGHVVCDGVMLVARCSACVLQKSGVPRPAADLLALLPPAAGDVLGVIGGQHGVWAAPRMSSLMRSRIRDTRAFLDAAEVVVAPTEWVRRLLIANAVSPAKITLSGQGVSASAPRQPIAANPSTRSNAPLRLVLLGRLDPAKGIDVVLSALSTVPELHVTVDVFGDSRGDSSYSAALRAAVDLDARVRLLPPIPREEVVEQLRDYDAMLVPSQGLETGPLVVLEAQAAGLPVIGSRLGGTEDRVEHDVNGWLVEPRSPSAWAAALREIERDRARLVRWRAGIGVPRTMRDVAAEMAAVYHALLGDVRSKAS